MTAMSPRNKQTTQHSDLNSPVEYQTSVLESPEDYKEFPRYDSSGYSTASTIFFAERTHVVSPDFADKSDPISLSERRGLTTENESTIKRNFRYLKEEIDVDCGLLDHFIQENIFTDDQVESVNSAGSRRRKVDCFLRMLLRSKRFAYGQFLDVLKHTKCDHIREFLESQLSQGKLEVGNCTVLDAVKGQHAIHLHYDVIVDQLEPDNIADFFIQYEEFTVDEYESVISQITRRDKGLKLLEILSFAKHMPRGYFVLLKALEDTKEIYLYQLLTSNLKFKSDPELHVKDTKQMTQILLLQEEQTHMKDENEIIIKTTIVTTVKKQKEAFGQNKDTEGKIIETIKMENVQFELNDILFSDTKCLITDVKKGSIVFRIKCCENNSLKELLKKGNQEGIQKILKVIFSHPHVQKYLGEGYVLVTELEYMKTCDEEKIAGKKHTSKDVLSKNYSFMVEEIDSVLFQDLDIFTQEEKYKLCELRKVSRAKATMEMFTFLLAKPESDVDKFLEEIKLKKKFIWNHICSEDVQYLPDDALVSCYDILVENISPSIIANHCIDNRLLPNYQAFASTVHQRKSRAKYMVHELLKDGSLEKTTFLGIVSKVDNSSWDLCKESQGCMLKSKLKSKDEVNEHCGSLSIPKPSENDEAASIGPCQELKQIDDERIKYKTKIKIHHLNKAEVSETSETEEGKTGVKRTPDQADTESGYESLSLNRRTELLEGFSLLV
ncbi:uncharacterized protein LOC132737402 isoform X2 [Ruditapes philippinarum]|uniref:uncharacterized protein LOC132737402 isoform X2 n=1 Tax=Ruditapes philippinarum TaxID=129788 RepID=UPI00295C160E|nr:uncharacterized protein LOC132737402 isoform X2 [Ruditapes philippinarum]